MSFHRILSALFLATLCFGFMPTAEAQKLNSRYRQFPDIGLEFKAFKDMSDVPVNDGMRSRGIIAQGTAEEGPRIKLPNNSRVVYSPKLFVVYDEPQGPTTGSGGDDEDVKHKLLGAKDYVELVFGDGVSMKKIEPEVSDFKSSKKIEGSLTRYATKMRTGAGRIPINLDVYTFYDGQSKLVFIWDYPNEDKKVRKKWDKVINKSMKSLRYIKKPDELVEFGEINSESNYEDLLAFHQNDVKQTPGWDLIETPSKKYVIKTNMEGRRDIKKIVKRLEASRTLFLEDFPPSAPMNSVSVVRICNTRDEFSTYGQTRPGVAGYFNPGSEELVLFFEEDAIEETLGVMTHEAFHQYCHFLFNRSAAHRWYDEGHGDYYGAWVMKGNKLKPAPDMEGGFARVPHLKDLQKNGQLAPLSEHIRYDHGTWQNQGPAGISNYSQSFALIYFLREGARKKVKKKYWEKEYADIIPNYIRVLNDGFTSAYEEVVKDATKDLEKLDKEVEKGAEPNDQLRERLLHAIASPWDGFRMTPDFPTKQQKIWDDAMEASWGQIDEAEFEKTWLLYIEKEM